MSSSTHSNDSARKDPPEWRTDRVVDPDGDATWLAVDTYPTAEDARKELAPDEDDFAEVHGTVRMRLRWLDLDDEDDAYIHDEWGALTTVEDDPSGREFWLVVTHPESPYRPSEAA